MLVVAQLRRAGGIILVGVLLRNFLEHLDEVHVHARRGLDEFLELLEDGHQLLGVFIGVLGYATHVLSVYTVVGGKPCTRSCFFENVSPRKITVRGL